jgi:predicted lipoprotein with Yx(FWY)xxD motif
MRRSHARPRMILLAAIAAGATLALAGIAMAKVLTLKVAQNAPVTNTAGMTTNENIAVSSHGRAVYTLSGDSKRHPECKSTSCRAIWPWLTVSSARHLSKAAGIRGKLGVWRHNRVMQLTLGGHPLYMYSGDNRKDVANGEGIVSFGGTWHVIKAASSQGSSGTSTTSSPPSSSSTPSNTTSPGYPQYP